MFYNVFVVISLALLVAFQKSQYKRNEYLQAIFIGLWAAFSFEYYTTIDYRVYYENFLFPPKDLWEPVYEFLVRTFRPFGYIGFNAVMAAFEMTTLYFMVTRFVDKKWYWLAIILIIANPDLTFNLMTVKRQFIAICVAIWIPYILILDTSKLKWIKAIVIFFIAINIHTSAYMSLLFFFLPLVKRKPGLIVSILICVLYLGCSGVLLSNTKMLYHLISYTGLAGRYEQYIEILNNADMDDFSTGLVERIYRFVMVTLLALFTPKYTLTQYKIVLISIAGYYFSAILFADLWRLAWFYTVFTPVSTAILAKTIWDNYSRYIAAGVIAASLLLPLRQYYLVMSGKTEAHQMFKFHKFYTIFDSKVDKSFYSQDEM